MEGFPRVSVMEGGLRGPKDGGVSQGWRGSQGSEGWRSSQGSQRWRGSQGWRGSQILGDGAQGGTAPGRRVSVPEDGEERCRGVELCAMGRVQRAVGHQEMKREKRRGVWSRGQGRGRRGRMQWRKGSQSLGLGWEEPCWLSGIYRQRDGGQGCCPTAHPDSTLAE